jgi:hypothetical protein
MLRNTSAILFFAAAGLLGCGGSGSPDIGGTWRTSCLAQSSQNGTFYAVYEDKNVAPQPRFTVTVYADSACTKPSYALGDEATQEVGAAISDIPGTYEYNIYYKRMFATAFDANGAALLQGAGCGTTPFTIGTEKDVTATGCLFFPALAKCAADYDIVKVDGDHLYNGLRSGANMCVPAGRPTALNSFFFTKVP